MLHNSLSNLFHFLGTAGNYIQSQHIHCFLMNEKGALSRLISLLIRYISSKIRKSVFQFMYFACHQRWFLLKIRLTILIVCTLSVKMSYLVIVYLYRCQLKAFKEATNYFLNIFCGPKVRQQQVKCVRGNLASVW